MTFQVPVDGERLPLTYNGVPWVMEYDAGTRAWKPVVSFEDVIAVTITGASVEITPGEFVVVTGATALWDPIAGRFAEVNSNRSLNTRPEQFGRALSLVAAGTDLTSYSGSFVGALAMARDVTSGDFARRLTAVPDGDDINIGGTYHLQTMAALFGYDYLATRWDRAHINPQGHIYVDAMVSGTVGFVASSRVGITGPADVQIVSPVRTLGADDQSAAVTGVLTASHIFAYDGVNWDRVYAGASKSLKVDLATRLDRTNDEVTAYVTGTLLVNPASSLFLNQRADVAIASPVGAGNADDLVSTTTGVLTRSMQLVYDEVGDNWDRWRGTAIRGGRVDLISGSMPWKDLIRAAVTLSGSGGEATLVAGIPGQRIKVMEVMLITDGNNQIIFRNGAGGAILSGPHTLPNSGDGYFIESPTNPDFHHFRTTAGTALVLDRSQITLLGGHINYYLEP